LRLTTAKLREFLTPERTMETEALTLGGLALLVAIGWIVDVLVHRSPQAHIDRRAADQLQRSARVIGS
jgi:hypothetical protein